MRSRLMTPAAFFAFACIPFVCPCARGADAALRYQFKDMTNPIYEVTIRAEMPDAVETRFGHLFYTIKSVDPANGQIILGYWPQFSVDRQQREAGNNDARPPRPPMPFSFPAPEAKPDIMIDSLGNVIRANRTGDADQLPYTLGLAWQLLLPPLPADNQATWKTTRALSLYSLKKQTQAWPPAPPWGQAPEERTERAAHETVSYTLGQANGNSVAIQRQYELTTDEKVGDSPLEKISGQGKFVVDTRVGLVQSLELSQTIEVNQHNVTVKIPVTVSARLLTVAEAAKFKADQEAAAARAAEESKKAQAEFAAQHANDVNEMPEKTVQTAEIGLDGGEPYIRVNKDRLPVIGFRIQIGSWGGHTTIGHCEPLYKAPADVPPPGATVCLAKAGYVVGGIIVNSKDGADGLRVIFVKKTARGVDAKDTYASEWFGYDQGSHHIQLAGKGERIIGTFGRQGMNMNKIGLVLEAPADGEGQKQAPAEEAAGKAREEAKKEEAKFAAAGAHAGDANEIPENTVRTAEIGLDGGSPYVSVNPDGLPVIGFTIRIGSWAGHTTIGHCEPLYAPPADLHPRGETVCVAKDGYVVGGIIVNSKEGADGLRVIFVKKTANGVDAKVSYMSPWFGYNLGSHRIQLAGHGERVIGTFGRQGMNMNKIGLVLEAPANGDAPKPGNP